MAQPTVDYPRYSALAQAFHWLSALAVLAAWTLGLLGDELPKGPPREIAEFAHVIAGELVVVMLVLRLAWRFVEPPPLAEASGMGRAADFLAKIGHFALYLLLLTVPLSGVTTLFAGGEPLSIFGAIDVGSPWERDRAFKHSIEEIHEYLAHGLLAIAALHAVAAIAHHHLYADNTLKRMLPRTILP